MCTKSKFSNALFMRVCGLSENCCRKGEQACPAGIIITTKEVIMDAKCVGCVEYVAICPVPDCLTLSFSQA